MCVQGCDSGTRVVCVPFPMDTQPCSGQVHSPGMLSGCVRSLQMLPGHTWIRAQPRNALRMCAHPQMLPGHAWIRAEPQNAPSAHPEQPHSVYTHCPGWCRDLCCVSARLLSSSSLSLTQGRERSCFPHPFLLESHIPVPVWAVLHGLSQLGMALLCMKDVAGQGSRGKLGFMTTVSSPGMEMYFYCGGRAHLFPMSMGKQKGGGTGICWLVERTKEDRAGCSTC